MRTTFATLGFATLIAVSSMTAGAQVRILPRPTATVDGSTEMLIKRIPEGNEFLLTVNKGQDMSFYTVQWYRDGVLLQGETAQDLRRPIANNNMNGLYTVELTSPCAKVMSKPIRVLVGTGSYIVETRVAPTMDAVAGHTTQETTGATFQLKDALPNPATDRTTISFSTTETSPVTVKVVDMNGRVIATLVNDVLSAGSHEVVLNTSDHDMASSLYYIVLSAPGFTETKPLVINR